MKLGPDGRQQSKGRILVSGVLKKSAYWKSHLSLCLIDSHSTIISLDTSGSYGRSVCRGNNFIVRLWTPRPVRLLSNTISTDGGWLLGNRRMQRLRLVLSWGTCISRWSSGHGGIISSENAIYGKQVVGLARWCRIVWRWSILSKSDVIRAECCLWIYLHAVQALYDRCHMITFFCKDYQFFVTFWKPIHETCGKHSDIVRDCF